MRHKTANFVTVRDQPLVRAYTYSEPRHDTNVFFTCFFFFFAKTTQNTNKNVTAGCLTMKSAY